MVGHSYVGVDMAGKRARAGHREEARVLRRAMRQMPSGDPTDPTYRRLRYIRYADDFLLGLAGPRAEAEEIQRQLDEFLRDTLKLELSETKTRITHARTEAARFLGYGISVIQADAKRHTRLAERASVFCVCIEPHSYRSAVSGSTFVARRAGR